MYLLLLTCMPERIGMRQNSITMKKIGITGGVGAGKSKVLEYLGTRGAKIYQADVLACQLQQPGTSCFEKIVEVFGQSILSTDGEIDRKELGNMVFSDKEKLEKLNGIVHPTVNKEIACLIEAEKTKGTRIFVLEAALLTEKVYRDMLDEIWYIYAEESTRKVRLMDSRGYTCEKINAMFAAQASEEVYRLVCDKVIDNSGAFESTIVQIEAALQEECDRRINS